MKKLNPHLSFKGDCETAFRFYERVLGGKILMIMSYGDSPLAGQVAPEWSGKVLHATLELDGQTLMGADATPDRYQKPQGFSIAVNVTDKAEAERVFRDLSEGGVVEMPLQGTFWAERFGMLTDRHGIPWMINCGKQG